MKKKLFFLLSFFFLYFHSLTAVTYNSEPKIFIQELIDDAIKTLADKSITTEEKNAIIEKIALENVDIKALGLYTLGKIRKDLDENTINDYKKSIVVIYSHGSKGEAKLDHCNKGAANVPEYIRNLQISLF